MDGDTDEADTAGEPFPPGVYVRENWV